MHRLFVAIKISEELEDKAFEFRRRHQYLPVRWLSRKNLHITLIPPWQTDDIETAKKLLHQISDKTLKQISTIKSQPFDLNFDEITFGPTPKNPRLIWASGKTPPEIKNLKANLEKIFTRPPENRPFFLHLTLARFRPEDFHTFKTKNLHEKINWQEKVIEIVLMESHLSPKGAEYEILEKVNF